MKITAIDKNNMHDKKMLGVALYGHNIRLYYYKDFVDISTDLSPRDFKKALCMGIYELIKGRNRIYPTGIYDQAIQLYKQKKAPNERQIQDNTGE